MIDEDTRASISVARHAVGITEALCGLLSQDDKGLRELDEGEDRVSEQIVIAAVALDEILADRKNANDVTRLYKVWDEIAKCLWTTLCADEPFHDDISGAINRALD